jgi:hypothetical protein
MWVGVAPAAESHPYLCNEALAWMDERFTAMYEADIKGGRPSIAP